MCLVCLLYPVFLMNQLIYSHMYFSRWPSLAVYVYVYVCIPTYIHLRAYVYAHMYIYIYVYTCMHVYRCTYISHDSEESKFQMGIEQFHSLRLLVCPCLVLVNPLLCWLCVVVAYTEILSCIALALSSNSDKVLLKMIGTWQFIRALVHRFCWHFFLHCNSKLPSPADVLDVGFGS